MGKVTEINIDKINRALEEDQEDDNSFDAPAKMLFDVYSSLIRAGFEEKQAMALTVASVSYMFIAAVKLADEHEKG